MRSMNLVSFVRTLSVLAVSTVIVGCGGGSEGTSSQAPEQSANAKSANDAYVIQIAKDAMMGKTNEKPGAASKAAPGAAPR